MLGWHEPGWTKAVDDRDEVLGSIRLPDGSLDPRLLRIGDVQFEVPPENIAVTKRLASKKVPLIRAKSSTMKGTGHAETMVEFTLYFTTLEQVNGRPYKTKLPSGKEVVYHVNGLRALISQFKKCPFLPVQNHFLNSVHNIDTLTLSELQVSTLPGFPGVLVARLVCFAFDYTGYIEADDFNAVFNWPLFRYYYQRSLRGGFGTYLAPIEELSDDFTFYVISEEELAKRKWAEEYLSERKYKPTVGSFIKEAEKSSAAGSVNEAGIRDLYYLEEALREWKEEVLPLKEKYARTGDERYTADYAGFDYYRTKDGDEWLEIPIQNPVSISEIERRFPGRIVFDPTLVTTLGTDVATKVLRIRPAGMKGHSPDDLLIEQIIRRNAFRDPKTGEYSPYLKELWEKHYDQYFEMLNLYKSEINVEEVMEPWPIANLHLVRATASLQNIIVPLQLQLSEGSVYQYLGSLDVAYRLEFETDDETAVTALRELLQRAAYLVRHYRSQIASGLLALDFNLTRLFGTKNIIIDEIRCETDSPDHYRVSVLTTGFDYAQYKRAMPQKVAEGFFYNRSDRKASERRQFDYGEVQKILKTLELYPDLELPTYQELKKAGFVDSTDGCPTYPDPDFYITVHVESIGDMVDQALKQPLGGQLQDAYGGRAKITTPTQGQKGSFTLNDRAQSMVKKASEIHQEYDAAAQATRAAAFYQTDLLAASSAEVANFVHMMAPYAYEVSRLTGVFPEVIISQWALETGWGTSDVFRQAKNLAGIKATASWTGLTIGPYRAYPSLSQAAQDYARVLNLNLYANVRAQREPYSQAVALGASPWAEDPRYGAKILSILPRVQGILYSMGSTTLSGSSIYSFTLPSSVPSGYSALGSMTEERLRRQTESVWGTLSPEEKQMVVEENLLPLALDEGARIKEDARKGAPELANFYDLFVRSTEDMRHCDRRGRLVRAFPVFLLFLVDEGRYINTYKLHDNFYSYHAISQISVHKTRKSAADTCVIELSNVYGGLDTLPFVPKELEKDPLASILAVIKSIFKPPVRELEKQRSEVFDRLFLRTGARIHLRIGYGSDASELPIMFNGTITELESGEVMRVVAQGDGIELTNNLPWPPGEHPGMPWPARQAGVAPEPRDLLYTILTWRGGYWQSFVNRIFNRRWFDESPLGIVHFGDLGESALFFWNNPEDCNAEVMQNIYAAVSEPIRDDDLPEGDHGFWGWLKGAFASLFGKLWGRPDEDNFEINIFDKTVWDVLQILAAATPDFIAAVHPFQFRSTIFFGKPYWDIIYDYERIERMPDGKIKVVPKKKPFRQFHIYTSFYDIVSNQIEASARDVHTCVIGVYTANVGGQDKPQTTPPIYADSDIDPDKQRTIHVYTENYMGGIRFLQGVPILKFVPNFLNWLGRTLGSGREQAMRIATSALRDFVKDMYQGELVVMGDPSVKPYDAFYLLDYYEDMSGIAEVKAVNHHLGFDTGFITGIVPDASVVISDPLMVQMWPMWNNITAFVAMKGLTEFLGRVMKYGGRTPVLNMVLAAAKKGQANLQRVLQSEAVKKALQKAGGSKLLRSLGELAAKGGRSLGDDVARLLAGAGAASVAVGGFTIGLPALAAFVVEFVVVSIISHVVGDAVGNWLANRQAVKICTLRKHGREFSAGIDGHKGMVYGDSADTITRIIRDNEFVRALLQWGLGVDVLDTAIAYMPFDEERNPEEYFERVRAAVEDLGRAEAAVVPSRPSQYGTGFTTGVRSRPAAADMNEFKRQNTVLPADAPQVLWNIRRYNDGSVDIASGGPGLESIRDYPYLRPEAWSAVQAVGRAVYARFGKKLLITSAYRPPTSSSSHATGYAVDIDIPSEWESYTFLGYMRDPAGREWLRFVVEQLVTSGFVEIIIGDKGTVNEVRSKYPQADVRPDWSHRNHIHCLYLP